MTRSRGERSLVARQFYALIWKDYVVHKRHYIWTLLETTIPVLVCLMAILLNTHQGKPKLESERTFDPDDFERLYGDLNPQRHTLLVAPNTSFTRALVDQIDDAAVRIELCEDERTLVELIKKEIPVSLDQVKRLLPDDNANVTIGGVVIDNALAPSEHQPDTNERHHDDVHREQPAVGANETTTARATDGNSYPTQYFQVTSKLDGKPMHIPINFHMSIRAKDFRLGQEAFPKKYSLGPFLHSDHYVSTFFMASQIMLSRAYINLLATYVRPTPVAANATGAPKISSFVIPTNEELIGQRLPYPKYVTHKRLKESTLGTFVAGSQKQKPFVLTMDYCITLGFLVTAIFLAKRIVDERKSRVRDMLRLVGVSDTTYYGSHMSNTMIIMLTQCLMITILFTGHAEAPAQNIDSSLFFVILILYCSAAVMSVLFLSTLFSSSTKAIIFTSLVWLGLPEVFDRVFKLNSGVIESNGFLSAQEPVHLAFCLFPNFALRLMNRILTECDIYGEFFAKKQLYGEYRAIWPNLMSVLPLYHSITVGSIMLVMLASTPFYMLLIYLSNASRNSQAGGLASLSQEAETGARKSSSVGGSGLACACSCCMSLVWLAKTLAELVISLFTTPFKLVYQVLFGNAYREQSSRAPAGARLDWSRSNLSQISAPQVVFLSAKGQLGAPPATGYLNAGYAPTPVSSVDDLRSGKQEQVSVIQFEADHQRPEKLHELQADSFQMQPAGRHAAQADSINDPKYFERSPAMLRAGVSIRHLCKTYNSSRGRFDAVRDVSLDMFYSQILVLLGHNGAGKTTLIDIISGHNQKTSGQVFIDGYNIDLEPAQARRHVGFCPQFDVLFERLTVEEHLYFYGIVKGARAELGQEIERLLVQSGLDVHRRKLSKALSGGYKRKLSLAIAMIANSKVLILDEPTSGMDPESRRKVWDFLQLIRHDRLILMTTHHMEEADALGDRIAVMSSGQVKCCGSALFLKRVFNAGYHLRISKSANWNQVAFDELIGAKYRLDEKLENFTPHELMYKFDADETGHVLPVLFDELERHQERVGIFGFGVTVSTMDDVFMKIGLHFKDVEAQEMQSNFMQKQSQMHGRAGHSLSSAAAVSPPTQEAGQQHKAPAQQPFRFNGAKGTSALAACRKERLEGGPLFRQHVRALLAKRYRHARKNWFQLLWILSISLACVASVVILIDLVIFKEELTPEWSREMTLEGAGYGRHTTAVYQFGQSPGADAADNMEALRDAAFPPASTASASASTSTTTTESTPSSSPSTAAPATTTTAAAATTTTSTTTTTTPTTTTTLSGTTLASGATSGGEQRRRRRTRRQATGAPRNDSLAFLHDYWFPEARSTGVQDLLTYTDINTQMIDLLTKQFADFREHYIVGGERMGKKLIAWYNGEATHSFPISMNIMLNSVLKQFTDLIEDNGHPLKGSRIGLRHIAMAQINTLIAFLPHLGRLINLVFLPFSLAFITSYFVIFPTHERVTRSKHLQLMTGVPARTFWLSHFLFDLFLYSIYTMLVLAIYFVWDRVINDHKIYFANFEHSVALVSLVTLFIFGALPLAYIFSFIAKKPTSAFSSFCVLTILTGTATLTMVSFYELKYEQTASTSFKLAFTIILWTARLIPSVSLLVGFQKLFALNTTRSICINISPEVLELLCRYINSPLIDDELRVLKPERCCRQACGSECYDQWPFFWVGWFGVNVELAMLAFDAALYWFILVAIESRSVRMRLSQAIGLGLSPVVSLAGLVSKARSYCWQVPQFVDNKDIHREQRRIEQIIESQNMKNYSLVANDLTKVYSANQFRAVDQLSFVVDKQEFFGLLGVNGAGKSTTFKMLTGELHVSAGNAWIGPHDVVSQRRQYLKQIGYCPQQDALIDSLSGVEMLTLFARLRGIPERQIAGAVQDVLERLGLSRIGLNNCNHYSGGNKRRLSVGMALIGAPELVFLDEPTSGVDPRSRRRLWSTLIDFQKETKSAIVMTSHSMNECECLCDRVAIMVGGQFKVLGSIQYLRTKLSRGFSLVLKLKPDNLADASALQKSSQEIHDYMRQCFAAFNSHIQLKDLHQTIIQYHIEPSAELSWSKMLTLLERAKSELELEDYQITSDASLESIFLSLAKNKAPGPSEPRPDAGLNGPARVLAQLVH